jgi:hypothetical protein
MYIVIAMNHKYLGHLTYATCRSYDPFSYGCLMYSSIFKWWHLTMCNHNHIITLSFAFERLTISEFFFWWIFTMFQPEKSDFQLGTRQWKFTKFQKRISVVGSKRVAQNISCFFFSSFFLLFYSQIWLNLLMDAYLWFDPLMNPSKWVK